MGFLGKTFRFLILLFSLFSLVIGTAGYLSYAGKREAVREESRRQLEAIAQLKIDQITNWLKERRSDAEVIFNSPSFIHKVREFLETPGNTDARREILQRLSPYPKFYNYHSVSILDPRGQVRLSLPDLQDRQAAPDPKLAERSIKERKILFSDLYRYPTSKNIFLDLYVPLIYEKSPVGLVLLRIDPTLFLYPLIQTWPIPSRTAETLLVRPEGQDVLFLNGKGGKGGHSAFSLSFLVGRVGKK